MLIPPRYRLTPHISQLLSSIEASRQVIESLEIPKEIEVNVRRQSILRSSLFSARIEGNTATLEDLPRLSTKDRRKQEIFNILKAVNWVYQKSKKSIKVSDLLILHKMTMDGLTNKEDLGSFRTQRGAIFNAAGIAIYLAPRPDLVPILIDRLSTFINSREELFLPVRATLAHYVFEKIHPFIDGNGRVGRLLAQAVLNQGGYGMRGLVSTEEYLDSHRDDYYKSLENNEKDVTSYLEFMLEAIASSASKSKEVILNKSSTDLSEFLLPRRAEILNIIRDHRLVNFDMIRRRFVDVNERTLRHDLKKLTDLGLVKKRGSTRGVYYEAIEMGSG